MSLSQVKDLPQASTFTLPNDAQKCQSLLATIQSNETYNTNMIQESKLKLSKYSQKKTALVGELANIKDEMTRISEELTKIQTEFKAKTSGLEPINTKIEHYTEQIKRANARLQNCAELKQKINTKINKLSVKFQTPKPPPNVFKDAVSDDDGY